MKDRDERWIVIRSGSPQTPPVIHAHPRIADLVERDGEIERTVIAHESEASFEIETEIMLDRAICARIERDRRDVFDRTDLREDV